MTAAATTLPKRPLPKRIGTKPATSSVIPHRQLDQNAPEVLQETLWQRMRAMPAHAHLNLLGWVSLFLMGIFYHLHPSRDEAKSASVQVWIWIVGTAVLVTGVGMLHSGIPTGEPIASAGSFIAFAGMAMFAWQVFRAGRAKAVDPLAVASAAE